MRELQNNEFSIINGGAGTETAIQDTLGLIANMTANMIGNLGSIIMNSSFISGNVVSTVISSRVLDTIGKPVNIVGGFLDKIVPDWLINGMNKIADFIFGLIQR